MTKIIAALLGACVIGALPRCAPHVPLTDNAEGAEQQPFIPQSDTPIDPGRLADCSPGTADCDRDHSNGCEATLADDPRNCGVCGTDCTVPNTETGCLGGTCRVIHCAPGYCDDDDDAENGCESAAKTCKAKAAPRR